MTENAFRTQLSSWRTSRNSAVTEPESESFLSRLNPFHNGRLRLPLTENEVEEQVEEPGWFTCKYRQTNDLSFSNQNIQSANNQYHVGIVCLYSVAV